MQTPPLSYRLFSIPLFIFWLLHSVVHSIRFKCWKYIPYRLGIIPSSYFKNSVWIHASSVGEVHLIYPLCHTLKQQGYSIFLTTFTATGYQQAKARLSMLADIAILPIDFKPISSLFASRSQCKVALITETELWPETLFHNAEKNTPIVHINARFSDKTLKASPWVLHTLKTTLSYFTVHLTRTEEDNKKLKQLGVSDYKIKILGNLKNTVLRKDNLQRLINKDYVLFASTHENEEILFINIIKALPQNTIAVIAPRHPKRGSSIQKQFSSEGLQTIQRSKKETITDSTQVYIADTLGEMPDWYAYANIVVMGGSFVPVGGHNVLEPAAYGAAIMTGPSDENIQADIELLRSHNAIIQVNSLAELETKMAKVLNHPHLLEQLAQQSENTMRQQHIVLDKYVEAIVNVVLEPESN